MADNWAIIASSAMMVISLLLIVFYLIPRQAAEIARNNDWLNGLRWRLLASSIFIFIAASPVFYVRVARWLGFYDKFAANLAALSVGGAFLAFSIAFISFYHYKNKE